MRGPLSCGRFSWRIAALILALTAPVPARAQSCFEDEPLVDLGHPARSMSAADMDADGTMDLVVAHADTNTVSVHLNRGPASFAEGVEFPTGVEPVSVAIADLDGDGQPDVVTADAHSSSLSVLLNRGRGRLGLPSRYHLATTPRFVTTSDVNGDGAVDLISANWILEGNRFTVSVLMNRGDGSFAPEAVYGVGPYPAAVTCADLDGDGDTDLVVANNGWHVGNGSITVLLNRGDGTFVPQPEILLDHPASITSIVSGDFDADGHVDLALPVLNENMVLLLYNRGDGRFERPVAHEVGQYPTAIWASDVDGDGGLDVVALGDDRGISVLRNLGGREFSSFVYSGSRGGRTGALADFDGDGRPDMATVTYTAFSVQRNIGDAEFAEPGQVLPGGSPASVTSADLDGDGSPDLISTLSDANAVSVLRNRGNGTFLPAVTYSVGDLPLSVACADLDGDGSPDLAVANAQSNTVSILLNRGDGTLRPAVDLAVGEYPLSVVCADLDGDGRPDLAVADRVSGTVSVLLNRGGARFAPPVDYDVFQHVLLGRTVAAADFDQDGHVDLAVAMVSFIVVLRNRGDGTFEPGVTYDADNQGYFTAGDLDGDGYPDLAVPQFPANVAVLLNRGDGTFGSSETYPAQMRPRGVGLNDFDGDGRPDLVVVNSDDDSVSVLHNDGGTFTLDANYVVGFAPWRVTAVDLDADGDPDIVVANGGESTLSILRNCRMQGLVFCAGDGSSAACPCGNTSAAGSGAGCLDSRGVGASLRATGSARIAHDGLVLAGSGLPNGIVLYVQGTLRENGGSGAVYCDGLRCVGGSLVRIGAAASAQGSSSYPRSGDSSVSHRGAVQNPGTRTYQVLYRDRARFCTTDEFNLSNGIEIVWGP